jgi:hypothetical protein
MLLDGKKGRRSNRIDRGWVVKNYQQQSLSVEEEEQPKTNQYVTG